MGHLLQSFQPVNLNATLLKPICKLRREQVHFLVCLSEAILCAFYKPFYVLSTCVETSETQDVWLSVKNISSFRHLVIKLIGTHQVNHVIPTDRHMHTHASSEMESEVKTGEEANIFHHSQFSVCSYFWKGINLWQVCNSFAQMLAEDWKHEFY